MPTPASPASQPVPSRDSDASLRRDVARLLVVRASGHLADDRRRYPQWELSNRDLLRLLEEGLGGVILLGGDAAELALRTAQLRAWSGGRLLLCADVEEGVGQRFPGASWLVPPLALGRLHREDPAAALALAERYGRCTGWEARRLGLNWVLAPVCDVNNNPANPVINVRAWGEDPDTVGQLAAAFLQGAQSEGVLCCAKHFPGHGDTAADSHLELPLLPHERSRLDAIELPPFRAAITAGVASVMTAHVLLPCLDAEHPATLSAAVLSGLLRRDLHFDGLVVTDALVMESISRRHGPGEAAVLALEAGADLVLMPADPFLAIDAVMAAVRQGRIGRADLRARLERRERALDRLTPPQETPPSPAAPLGALSNGPRDEDRRLAVELVRRSLWCRGGPVAVAPAGINLLRVDTALASPFLSGTAPALTQPAAAGFRPLMIDGLGPPVWDRGRGDAPLALERLGEGPVLVQLFIRGNPFRGSAGGGEEPWPAVVRQLQDAGRLAGLIVYGSPYLWETLLPLLADDIPAAWSPGQMPLAQKEALARLGFGSAAGTGDGERRSGEAEFTD